MKLNFINPKRRTISENMLTSGLNRWNKVLIFKGNSNNMFFFYHKTGQSAQNQSQANLSTVSYFIPTTTVSYFIPTKQAGKKTKAT